MSFDYTTVGHVTADVMADGSRRAGGSAFYSALQAARLGQRALILTRGVRREIEELLAPHLGELELEVIDAPDTTTLQTFGEGTARSQRLLAWAGAIDGQAIAIDTAILHLAPVARETSAAWRGAARFVGLTPQGLVRGWAGEGHEISSVSLDPALVPERSDAIVISETERDSCAALLSRTSARAARAESDKQAVVAVTSGAGPTELHLADGAIARVAVPRVAEPRDDIGAGDVFAAAFFTALAQGRSPRQAASFANAAAAVRIAGAGPDAIGDERAIEARLVQVA